MSSSFPNPLTEQEEQYYVKLLEKNDPDARLVLIERNLRLVAHIAKKYAGPMTSQDDLISIGTIGLIKAVNTYTSKKSTRLATYAAKCIENEILMSIRASKRIKQEVSLSLPIGTDKDGNEISFNDILGTDKNVLEFSMQLAKMMKLKTVAEGVETEEQAERIRSLGGDYIQGYLFSKPLPRDRLEEFIREENGKKR